MKKINFRNISNSSSTGFVKKLAIGATGMGLGITLF